MISFLKYSYQSTRFQTLSFCTGEVHYLLPDLVPPQNQIISQKEKEQFPIQIEPYYLDILPSVFHWREGTWVTWIWKWQADTLDILERVTTNVFSLSALILPSICMQVFIYSFSKHMEQDGVYALLEPIEVERWIRLNLCPWKIYILIEEQEKTNEK